MIDLPYPAINIIHICVFIGNLYGGHWAALCISKDKRSVMIHDSRDWNEYEPDYTSITRKILKHIDWANAVRWDKKTKKNVRTRTYKYKSFTLTHKPFNRRGLQHEDDIQDCGPIAIHELYRNMCHDLSVRTHLITYKSCNIRCTVTLFLCNGLTDCQSLIGLRREEGDPILDSRVIDGFKVKFSGDGMCIHYQTDVKLKEVYAGGFEDEMTRMINEVKKFLQREYKAITGNSISLKSESEPNIMVQSASRVRSFVQAYQWFKINKIDSEPILSPSEDRTDKAIRDFLSLSTNKRPQNDTRK